MAKRNLGSVLADSSIRVHYCREVMETAYHSTSQQNIRTAVVLITYTFLLSYLHDYIVEGQFMK